MKKCLCLLAALLGVTSTISAQEVKFEEYDLSNGLHVVLHKENAAPVVTVGVMYQIGAKDEIEGRTGFAHFFEHLLFEGTENIERGKWFDIVYANGGSNKENARLSIAACVRLLTVARAALAANARETLSRRLA